MPVPSAQAALPVLAWSWCTETACLRDEGSLYIESHGSHSLVEFSGYLGFASCESWGGPVYGSVMFPLEVNGQILRTTVPCTDVWSWATVFLDLPEMPWLGISDICDLYGGVSADTILGPVSGSGSYTGFCTPEEEDY